MITTGHRTTSTATNPEPHVENTALDGDRRSRHSGTRSPTRLYTDSELADLPRPEWLVDGIIPAGGFAELYGPSASGKSFVALSLGLSIAAGTHWFGRVVRPGPVVYVAAEGRGGYPSRVQSWKDAHGFTRVNDFRMVLEPVQLLDDEEVEHFLASLAEAGVQPALVVIDTLARSMAGGDENSTSDMSKLVDSVQRIQQTTGAAVLLVHHTGKSGSGERGSTAVRCAVDVMIAIRRSRSGLLTIRCEKMKDASEFDDFALQLTPRGDSCALTPSTLAPTDPCSPADGRALLELLPPKGLKRGDWKKAAVPLGITGGTFDRNVAALREQNAVTQSHRGGVYLRTAA